QGLADHHRHADHHNRLANHHRYANDHDRLAHDDGHADHHGHPDHHCLLADDHDRDAHHDNRFTDDRHRHPDHGRRARHHPHHRHHGHRGFADHDRYNEHLEEVLSVGGGGVSQSVRGRDMIDPSLSSDVEALLRTRVGVIDGSVFLKLFIPPLFEGAYLAFDSAG